MPHQDRAAVYRRIAMSPVPVRKNTLLPGWGEDFCIHSLHRSVTRPSTPLQTLCAVKAYAKGRFLLDHEADEDERGVYLAVYLTAIAGALRWHNELITTMPASSLASSLKWAARQGWLPPAARKLCDPLRLLEAVDSDPGLRALAKPHLRSAS